jgi:hypothetical protein
MKKVSKDPHGGPLPGDASYRLQFASAEDFQRAMALAARLEAKGLHRRAWRVRWNLDGQQPARMPVTVELEPDEHRGGRASVEVPGLARMVERTGLSNWQIGRALNISSRAVKNWRHGGRITPESYAKLQEFCK